MTPLLSVCPFKTSPCVRFERTHGGVFNLHTVVTHRYTHRHRHTHRHTQTHTENTHTQDTHGHTHTHTENTQYAGPKQAKKQRFLTKNRFFDALENVICTKSLFPNVRRRSTRAGARRRCASLKTPLEPLTKSFTADYLS